MKNNLEYRSTVVDSSKYKSPKFVQAIIYLNNDGYWKTIKLKPYKNACIYLTTHVIIFESAQ